MHVNFHVCKLKGNAEIMIGKTESQMITGALIHSEMSACELPEINLNSNETEQGSVYQFKNIDINTK